MNLFPWRRWIFVCGASLLALPGIALARARSTPPKPTPEAGAAPKRAEEQYKNIQALKGIPADQVIPSMQFIAASLGVECKYGHVEQRDKDDKKPKVTARKMIAMMMAINKESFEGHREVTCYSCHRGSPDHETPPRAWMAICIFRCM